MHRFTIAAALAAVSLTVFAVSAATAAEVPFSAQFKGKQTRNDPPCPGGAAFCGSGTVDGFGPATYSVVPTSIGPRSGSCQSVTGIVNIALADASGTLTLDATGRVCYPGKSQDAPGQLRSFGNPFRIYVEYEVVGGTGVFSGAAGTGTAVLRGAGAATKAALEGVLVI